MPTYEYACTSCGHHLEVVQSFHDEPLTTCPDCGESLRKVFGSIGIAFKGSGFYKTDSRSGSSWSAASAGGDGASKTESSSKSDGSSSTPATSPSDSKGSTGSSGESTSGGAKSGSGSSSTAGSSSAAS